MSESDMSEYKCLNSDETEENFALILNDQSLTKDSRDRIETIRKSCSQTLARIERAHARLKSSAARAIEADKQARWNLEEKLEKSWRQIGEARVRAKKMRLLTSEIYFLGKLLVQDVGIEMGQERSLVDVVRERELAEKRCQMLAADVEKLDQELRDERERSVEMSRVVQESRLAKSQVEQSLLDSNLEIKRLEREIERLNVGF